MNEFYNEVICKDARFHSVDRVADLGLLEPETRQKILNLMAAARVKGLDLIVFETFRSQQRQMELYRQGMSRLKTVGGHHYGLACDLFKIVKLKNGAEEVDEASLLEQLAQEQGLFCGSELKKNAVKFTFFDPAGLQMEQGDEE